MKMPARIHAYLRASRGRRQSGANNTLERQQTHKEYARMPLVKLPRPQKLPTTLGDTLASRSSRRASRKHLTAHRFSTLLHHSLSRREDGRRPYPSAGGLYPIEIYIIALDVPRLSRNVFHFNLAKNALEELWPISNGFDANSFAPTASSAQAFLVFTSVWQRTETTYGDFGYLHALLEAGHLAQNVLLVSTALHLTACPLGGFDDAATVAALDIDAEREQPIYAIALGSSG